MCEYVQDSSYYEIKNKNYLNMLQDLKKFKDHNFTETDNFQSIFINMSLQSNSYINFMNNMKKLIGKNIRLYFYKLNSIEKICDVFIENKIIFDKIVNVILYSDHDYHTNTQNIIDDFIKLNNITNFYIYY